MSIVRMKELLEAGVHFGHRSPRWNPKMRSFIFTERNGIHIIDLQQTIVRLEQAYNFVRDVAAEGGIVIFVGTKKQAQDNLTYEAQRCGMPYVNRRWLGGTLTNFRTIRQRIDYLLDLETQKEEGGFDRLPKKEALGKVRELAKLDLRLGGLRNLHRLPEAIFVVDTYREAIAVKEANILGIPVVAMVDTNCDPDPIDYIIPANDDAIRAIKLITSKVAEAVMEGQQMRGVIMAEEEVPEDYIVELADQEELVPVEEESLEEDTLSDTDEEPSEADEALDVDDEGAELTEGEATDAAEVGEPSEVQADTEDLTITET